MRNLVILFGFLSVSVSALAQSPNVDPCANLPISTAKVSCYTTTVNNNVSQTKRTFIENHQVSASEQNSSAPMRNSRVTAPGAAQGATIMPPVTQNLQQMGVTPTLQNRQQRLNIFK